VCIDKNTSENIAYVAAGSPAMFMDKIFKQLPDNQVTIIAPYGNDFLKYKDNANIYPINPISDKTLIYENITKNGARQQKAHNRNYASPIPISNKSRDILSESDIVFIAPLTPDYSPEYLTDLLSSSKENALKIILPQGYYRDFDDDDNVLERTFSEADKILPLVDVAVVSDQDHPDIIALAKLWSKNYHITVIVTLSENGAIAITADQEIQLPTRAVPENEIVDSVGSGDIFSAGFAYRYHQTYDIKEAGRFANELARQCLFFTSNEIKINFQALMS
jgi:sugar/nucleoside kinase (ribokinase family)